MKLLNPIYDTVFKFLMEDIEIAKGLISLIIEEEIAELLPAPQESTTAKLTLKYNQLELQRLDYVGIIKTSTTDGVEEYQKVTIEVQKSPFVPELGRFRDYVGEKYKTQSKYKTKDGITESYLPLKTIYLVDKEFNKNLPAVLRRKGEYWDVLEKKEYTGGKEKYVELLNHDSWFLQIARLPKELKNELLYVLSVFAPWMRDAENERFIEIPDNKEAIGKYYLFQKIVNRLQLAGNDSNLKISLELELAYEKFIDDNLKQAEIYKNQAIKERSEKEEERRQKEQAQQREEIERQQKEQAQQREEIERQQKEQAQQREEIERQQKEQAQQREEQAKQESRKTALKLAKIFKESGEPDEYIMNETGLSKEDIKQI